jgi:hypothetical protein
VAEPSNASQEGASRWYLWPKTGERFPSVTTILSVINKPAIPRWAAKSVAEYAIKNHHVWSQLDGPAAVDLLKGAPWRYTSERMNLGTAVHEAVERYILKQPAVTWPADIAPYMASFERFLEEWRPRFESTETSVYSRTHGYAGTLDMLVWIDGELILLDVKTGKRAYPEAGLQLNAYARADFIGLDDGTEHQMPPVVGAGVLLLRPRKYEVLPTTLSDTMLDGFLAARNLWRWQEELAELAFGRPMLPMLPESPHASSSS